MKKIAMIGIGKLGQDCAEVMASLYDVIGYDVVQKTPKFPMATTIEEAVKDRELIFIAAPTPHEPNYGGETPTSHLPCKDFDYDIVKSILIEVNKYTNNKQLVVLISTVLPGTVRNILIPLITNARFIYNPYLIAMGTVKWDMVNPEMIIIGTEDGSLTGDAQELIEFYKPLMQNDPRFEIGTWDEAESIKIFYNTFISTKLALVNMIQDVAEKNGNINVDIVTNALAKSTHRIMGPAYMKAGLGDAGACHPRDNIALRYLAENLNLGYDLFDSIMKAREVQAENMALRCLKNGKNITIIGKAYKPSVPYINGSASMLVGFYIEKHGGNVNYYDKNTNDLDLKSDWTEVYLIGYWEDWVKHLPFSTTAVIIDPWRQSLNYYPNQETIYYGDTRPKKKLVPGYHNYECHRQHIYSIWPELKKYESEIHIIYANVNNEYSFMQRNTEDICQEILSKKLEGKSKFFFHNLSEGAMPFVITKIHKIAKILKNDINSKQFFYLSSTVNLQEVYEDFAKEKCYSDRINVLSADFFLLTFRQSAKHFQNSTNYNVKLKDKKFLCFNKMDREHRLVLLENMFEHNLVEKAFYSFEGSFNFMKLLNSLPIFEFKNIIKNKHLFPLRLNITESRHNPVDVRDDDLKYFDNSYFSVVTETLYYNKNRKLRFSKPFMLDGIFVTEKIYKCIALSHPFLVFTRPKTLEYLKNKGFKTFAPYIDESYDETYDDDLRFNKLVTEIIRLSNLSDEEILKFQTNVKPIVDFNKEHFFSITDFRISNALQFFE